jgi:hypothetical protein
MIRTPFAPLLGILLLGAPLSAGGQELARAEPDDGRSLWAGALVVSSLGLGPEFSGRSSPIIGLRGGYFLFGFSHHREIQGIAYDLKPRLRNGTIMLDLFPGGGLFRVSGGVIFSSSRVDAKGVLAGPVTIGDRIYQPADVGDLNGKATYEHGVIPYAGIGFSSQARFTVTVDLGVGFSGYPRVELTADSPLTGTELQQLEASVAQEQAQIQQEIESHGWAKFYPVVSLGFKFRF